MNKYNNISNIFTKVKSFYCKLDLLQKFNNFCLFSEKSEMQFSLQNIGFYPNFNDFLNHVFIFQSCDQVNYTEV